MNQKLASFPLIWCLDDGFALPSLGERYLSLLFLHLFTLPCTLKCSYYWPYINTFWIMSLLHIFVFFFCLWMSVSIPVPCDLHQVPQCMLHPVLFGGLYTVFMIIHFFWSCKMCCFCVCVCVCVTWHQVPKVISVSKYCIRIINDGFH